MRREEEEAFLFQPASGAVKLLNATGLEAWGLLDGCRDTQEVARTLCELYPEAEPAAVAQDVSRFLDDLLAAGLVEVASGEF